MDGYLVADEWTARCGARLAELLPHLGTAMAAERAQQMTHDAYDYEPEVAAAVYALELGPHDVPWQHDLSGDWAVAFYLPDGTDAEIRRAEAAAAAVLEAHGVTAKEGARAKFVVHHWDPSGMAPRDEPSDEQHDQVRVWVEAEDAANATIDTTGSSGEQVGSIGALPPSVVRFRAAFDRWRARRVKEAVVPTGPARALWLDRFAARLGALQPTLSPEVAWQHAESSFAEAFDLSAEDAAEIFALEEPPGETGAPE